MVSHIADVLRRGIWASFTGGWFYDTSLDLVSNVIHLYLWSSLLVAPYILFLLLPPSVLVWGTYCTILGVMFFVLKFGNHLMHRFFDNNQSEGGVRNGQQLSDKDNSSHGSLESLSEHLAAFCTDPDVLADWRRLHPRRRQAFRSQNPVATEDIPLQLVQNTSSPSAAVDGNDSSRSKNPSLEPVSEQSTDDRTETNGLSSGLNEINAGTDKRSDSLGEISETINFRAEVHIHEPLKTENSKDPDGAREEDSLLSAENTEAHSPLKPISERRRSPMLRQASASQLHDRGDRHGHKRVPKTRPQRDSCVTSNDNSVTSVVNQPTTSLEQILSTFKPPYRPPSTDGALLQSSTSVVPQELPQLSPKGLRRARSEFYTPNNYGQRVNSAKVTSEPSVSVASTSIPPSVSELNAMDENTHFAQTVSMPGLELNNRKDTVSAVDETHQNIVQDSEVDVQKSYEQDTSEKTGAVDDEGAEIADGDRMRRGSRGLRRSNAITDRHRLRSLTSETSVSSQRPPPFGLGDLTAAEQLLRDTDRSLGESSTFRPDPQLEPFHDDNDSLFTAFRNRPIRASSLLRRERENRALMRADSPDPRARIESLTNSRGLLETFTSWITGTNPPSTRLAEEFSDSLWPSLVPDRPTLSRATSSRISDADHDTAGTRYSPQTSIVSAEMRPEYDLSGPSRLTAVDSGSSGSGRMRFTVLTNPLWQGDDTIHESGGLTDRPPEQSVSFGERRNTWHLMPDTTSGDRAAAAAAALMRSSAYGDDKSSNSWEYRLGPKSWRELFGEERTRNPRVRFQRPLYKIPIFPWTKDSRLVSLHLDRLTLMALFDRTRSVVDCVIAIVMCVMVGAAGGCLLAGNYYHDLWAFVLCFVMAGCQYSLVKSAQPDAASPTHGFNRVTVYSRAVYFCLGAGLVFLSDYFAHLRHGQPNISLFGLKVFTPHWFVFVRDALTFMLLCFPVIFAYGLLPQVNTFPMYVFEQIEIHLFGGTATFSLLSSVYVLFRNSVAVLALHGICYAALDEVVSRGSGNLDLSFALFSGLLIAVAYHLSRSSSDPVVLWSVMRRIFKKGDCQSWAADTEGKSILETDMVQDRIEMTVYDRLRSDVIICPIIVMIFFGLQGSTLFSTNPVLTDILISVAVALGWLLSYVVPKMRAQMPWLCFSKPLVPSYKNTRRMRMDEEPPEVTIFEAACLWLRIIERNLFYPFILLGVLTNQTVLISGKFGPYATSILVTTCGLKFLRLIMVDAENQYLILAFTSLYFRYDAPHRSETFLLDYCLVSFLYYKLKEWLQKWKFIMTYVAPWQITWGSAFHAFAQPFSVPHSGMLIVQSVISTIISSPLNPFLGSAIFLTSYPRPVKFWEKDYKTRRLDHSNTRLDAQLDGHSGNDDNNLNSIFYEHLTHSLQKSLCGDIMMGKWGNVMNGDFFILASDYLNCLVHIIETGNGLITFQVRGLEFRGTYCQQREVEAITENVDENRGFCCCEPGHLPHMLSLNSAFNQRWLAWQVFAARYIVQGYSVSDNNASTMFQIYDLRRVLVTFYVKTIIYHLTKNMKLLQWLMYTEREIIAVHDLDYHDLDTLFVPNIDVDFDFRCHGISRHSFYQNMQTWIDHCVVNSEFHELDTTEMSPFVTLAFAMSVCGRRVLGAAAQLSLHSVDWFLHGLHALFKGDFRINCPRDEWVFNDMDLLHKIVAPAIRMALKLHQDHFTSPDYYERNDALYDTIVEHEGSMVICHEGDPKWRQAVLANTPSLLALRHVVDDNRDDYKIIMLNIRNLDFRLIKLNKECVRGFWAGQLQELVYFRNRNPERGSIQNAKQALRNMINSSCDQPIGYPIYVSPLTTSYADTHEGLRKVVGGPLTWETIRDVTRNTWEDVRDRCYASCSGSSGEPRVMRPREPPLVVSYNPQGLRPVEIRRPDP